MNPFWFLLASGVAILVEIKLMDLAAQRGYQRGFEEGRKQGRYDFEMYFLVQDLEIQRAREKMWMEER